MEVTQALVSFASGGVVASALGFFLKERSEKRERRRLALENLYLDTRHWFNLLDRRTVLNWRFVRGDLERDQFQDMVNSLLEGESDKDKPHIRINMRLDLYFPSVKPARDKLLEWLNEEDDLVQEAKAVPVHIRVNLTEPHQKLVDRLAHVQEAWIAELRRLAAQS